MEVVHPLETGLVMDGVQGCQTPSKRLKAILSVSKWQKQMTEIQAGSHCYGLPDTDAVQVDDSFWKGTTVGSRAKHWSRLTTRDTSNSPSKRKAHKQPIWSRVDVFMIRSLFWQHQWGMFCYFSPWRKNCIHVFKKNSKLHRKLETPRRHQMTALHWKLWVNYVVATLILPMSYCWLNVSSVSKSRLLL